MLLLLLVVLVLLLRLSLALCERMLARRVTLWCVGPSFPQRLFSAKPSPLRRDVKLVREQGAPRLLLCDDNEGMLLLMLNVLDLGMLPHSATFTDMAVVLGAGCICDCMLCHGPQKSSYFVVRLASHV
jgi:hypothetical protein